MISKGKVYIEEILAGYIHQDEDSYIFTYDKEYLKREDPAPVSLTLPVREQPYLSNILFPFFDGLIPEGWLLEIAQKNWKIDGKDRMKLLLTVCNDCIGNVSVVNDNGDSND